MNRTKYAAIFIGICLCIITLFGIILAGNIFETCEKGKYQIKQAAYTGEMTARMTPGTYLQLFGDITTWPKAETFYFTSDNEEGLSRDQSIEVRFNDGSLCNVSGTLRVMLPGTEKDVIALTTEHGYLTYAELEHKLILPTVRNALRLTANLMSARESYAEQRTDFIFWSWDQVQNGLYETREETRKVLDQISGEEVTRTFKVIKKGKDGNPIYQKNPLHDTGIKLANFEVKQFVYSETVKKQIAAQQEAFMAVATAKANAQKAEQDALTEEASGKARVMKAKYQKEEEKMKAVVDAQKIKETTVIAAQMQLEEAKLLKQAAKETKEKEISLGQGEAERKRLVLQADGALKQKLETYESVQTIWAKAFATRNVPTLIMGNGSDTDKQTNDFAQMMQLLVAKQMGLDLSIPKGATRQ